MARFIVELNLSQQDFETENFTAPESTVFEQVGQTNEHFFATFDKNDLTELLALKGASGVRVYSAFEGDERVYLIVACGDNGDFDKGDDIFCLVGKGDQNGRRIGEGELQNIITHTNSKQATEGNGLKVLFRSDSVLEKLQQASRFRVDEVSLQLPEVAGNPRVTYPTVAISPLDETGKSLIDDINVGFLPCPPNCGNDHYTFNFTVL